MNNDEEGARLTRLEENRARIAQHRAEVDGSRAPHGSQWIEWKGGECPVADGVRVDLRFRNGEEYADFRGGLSWRHYGSDADIIAYRVCAPLETGAMTDQRAACGVESSADSAKPQGSQVASPAAAHPPASPAATPIEPVTDDALGNPIGTAYLLKFPAGMQKYEFVSAYSYRTLERECADLRGQNSEWLAANAPGGWIDDLRGKLAEAQAEIKAKHRKNVEIYGRLCHAESALSTARQDALEEAAKVADGYNYGPCGQYDYGYTDAQEKADERAGQIADNIRAIKGEGK